MKDLEQLSALRDGDLDQPESLRDRLAEDPALQAKWAALDELVLDLADLPLETPPAALDERVLNHIERPRAANAYPWRKVAGIALLLAGTAAASSLVTSWFVAPVDAPLGPARTAETPELSKPPSDEPQDPEHTAPPAAVPPPNEQAPKDTGFAFDEGAIPEFTQAEPSPQDPNPDGFEGLPKEYWPAPAPAHAPAHAPVHGPGVWRVAGSGAGPSVASGSYEPWSGLPLWAVLRGDTGCETDGTSFDHKSPRFSEAQRACLVDLAGSDGEEAERASFWLLGEVADTDAWLARAQEHVEEWPDKGLSATIGVALLAADDGDFEHYAALAYPWPGRTHPTAAPDATRLYARWYEAQHTRHPTRLSWHEAVDAAAVWRTALRSAKQDTTPAQGLISTLAAAMPMPKGCDDFSTVMKSDDATVGSCLVRVAEDDSYPDAIRATTADESLARFERLDDPDGQLRAARARVDTSPGKVSARVTLAELCARLGLMDEAAEHADRAVALDSSKAFWAESLRGRQAEPAVTLTPADSPATTCLDRRAMESAALLGRLTTEDQACLEARLATATEQREREEISRMLLINAWSRSDRESWVSLAERHFAEIRSGDPDLRYKHALVLSKHGVVRADAVIRSAEVALEHRSLWTGDTYTSRVQRLYKLRAGAANQLWKSAEETHAASPSPESDALRERARGKTKVYAREWYESAKAAQTDTSKALQLCVSAAGTMDYCESSNYR